MKTKRNILLPVLAMLSILGTANCKNISPSDTKVSITNHTDKEAKYIRVKVMLENQEGKIMRGSVKLINIDPGKTKEVNLLDATRKVDEKGKHAKKKRSGKEESRKKITEMLKGPYKELRVIKVRADFADKKEGKRVGGQTAKFKKKSGCISDHYYLKKAMFFNFKDKINKKWNKNIHLYKVTTTE